MAGGVIKTSSATGDVYFLAEGGREVLPPSRNVTVKIRESFPGTSIDDAVGEATKFAIGALQQKMAYKTRGVDCRVVVRNVKIKYKVGYGFAGPARAR